MIFIYVVYGSSTEARSVSEALLEGRLVACANIFPGHEALYWWEGKIAQSGETAVIYKAPALHFEAIEQKIVALHRYDVPCIVALPIEKGHEPFLQWIGKETVD